MYWMAAGWVVMSEVSISSHYEDNPKSLHLRNLFIISDRARFWLVNAVWRVGRPRCWYGAR